MTARHALAGQMALGVMLAAFSAQVHAAPPGQSAGSTGHATGLATATVIRPLSVAATTDMDFGTITHAPGAGGTVTVSPWVAGASFGGSASAVCAGSLCSAAHAAGFAVQGEALRSYSIQLPPGIVARGTSGAATLDVGALTTRSVSGGVTPQLDSTGSDRFEVGGTITLPADLPAARYRASFNVIVSYI